MTFANYLQKIPPKRVRERNVLPGLQEIVWMPGLSTHPDKENKVKGTPGQSGEETEERDREWACAMTNRDKDSQQKYEKKWRNVCIACGACRGHTLKCKAHVTLCTFESVHECALCLRFCFECSFLFLLAICGQVRSQCLQMTVQVQTSILRPTLNWRVSASFIRSLHER
jgi:hypothetical protein